MCSSEEVPRGTALRSSFSNAQLPVRAISWIFASRSGADAEQLAQRFTPRRTRRKVGPLLADDARRIAVGADAERTFALHFKQIGNLLEHRRNAGVVGNARCGHGA